MPPGSHSIEKPDGPNVIWMDHHPETATTSVNRASPGSLATSGALRSKACVITAA